MRTTTILLLASAAMACNDKGSTTDDTGTYVPVDADGDGFTDDVDCNDDDPEINPYAAELCDDIDNDCDGLIDDEDDAVEDASSFYSDADGDGYGDPDSETMACSQPDGLIEDNSDCDDLNYEISPGAEEICDDIDNDCDEEVDEDVLITFYSDGDGDGYGLEEESVEACETPSGYAEMADDCDDTNSETYPGAEERCDDIDNDCDEDIDEDVLSIWYGDSDDDGYGDADAMIKNCDPPSGYVADSTDCDDTVQEINPGAEEICDDIDNDCDLAIDDEDDDVVDPNTWYLDSDSDGFGDGATSTQSCDQPSSYVADNTDCDDDATDVNPDAAEICDTIDNDCDGDIDDNDADVTDQGTWYADSDEDGYGDADNSTTTCEMPSGYVADATDCDDGDSAVNNAATEVCDDIDNDCDGDIDDDDADVSDQSTWYADSDEDGYGDADSTTEACDVPSGYVADTTDCDDGDSAVNTAAVEVCDDIDNDCDGDIDDDDADVSDQSTWYADADEDGYGDSDSSTEACDAPSGYVSDATDCDDDASDVSPAETEICNDDIDNDCDGTTGTTDTGGVCENIDMSLGDANLILLGVNASDTAGTSVAWLGDVDGDGADDFAVGAPYEDSTASAAGSTYIMTQIAIDASSNETRSLADAKLQITGEIEADHSGQSMTGGDMNGDGFSDVWIGAPQEDTDGNGAGAAYLLLGPLSSMATELSGADVIVTGGTSKEFLGWTMSATGDIDGDDCADMLVSAPQDPLANANAGSATGGGIVYLMSGASMYPSDCSGEDLTASYYSNTTGDAAGYSLSFTDTDGDGVSEVLIGAPDSDLGAGANSGAAYLAYADTSGDYELGTDMVTFAGESYYDRSGWAVAGNGDVNGDGYDDVLITAEQDDDAGSNAGATYVWLGPVGITEVQYSQADADAKITGATSGDRSGYAVSYAGDVDGDGNDDLLIGAWKADGDDSTSGIAHLLMGPVSGTVSLSDAQATFAGTGGSDQAGSVLAGGGDFDSDGVPDMLIGARYNDDAGSNAGAAYLILGISQ